MNTERTPEQIAAELYPIPANFNKPYTQWDMTNAQRAAWLSRQSEVDRLKRQVEELMAFNETCLQNNKSLTAAKEKELEELKRQLEEKQMHYHLERISYTQDFLNQLTAKENEITELKRQVDGMEKKYLDALDYKDQIHIDVVKDLTNELAAKEKELEELKTKVDRWIGMEELHNQHPEKLAAKEKELEELKEQLGYNKFGVGKLIEQNAKLKATHDAEMCAFAEWIDENELVRIIKYGDVKWYSNKIGYAGVFEKPHTTIELLPKFRKLEAANCDHNDCRNNSKDLRQPTTNSSQPDKWSVVHITDEYDSPEEAQEHIETIHKKMRQYYRIVKITTI